MTTEMFGYDYAVIPLSIAVTPEIIAQHGIGLGDEVVIAGLFTQRHGRDRNLPILRGGLLASMPNEPLFDERTGFQYNAYIVEVRSIGGLSGSDGVPTLVEG
jgi:hypothetical protein